MTVKRLSETEIKNLLSLQPLFEDLTNIFPDYPFLNVLSSPHGQQLLNEICTRRVYAPGEIILRENDLGDTLYIILSGHVAIVKGDLSTPTLLGVRSHGAIVGEMALLEHRTRSASVIAIDESELLATDLAGFQRLLNEPPFAGINLLEMLSARLRASDEILAQGTLRQRQLSSQVTNLESEKQHLMEMQRLREEMSDLLVHDLRNPLTAIYMAAKALEIQLPVEIIQENQTLISILFSNVKRMQRLIASMLEVARMEAG
jgi:CRP-like cAMP-binding protein